MYQPELKDEVVRALYRVAKSRKQPMTRLAEELIKQSLREVDKEAVCRACISEGNQDCGSCVLSQISNGKEQKPCVASALRSS